MKKNCSLKTFPLSLPFLYWLFCFLLAIAYLTLLLVSPYSPPNGLSEAEMASAAHSYALQPDSVMKGDLVNLPYRALQKLSISVLGLSVYSVKLPVLYWVFSFGLLLILLLNRWFKTNVALLASILAVLSASFLYLAGSGTPLIMLVFWPTLLLWLGSKSKESLQAKTRLLLHFRLRPPRFDFHPT